MWFRRKKTHEPKAEEAAAVAVAEPVPPPAPSTPVAAGPAPGGMLAARLHAPLKTQQSSSDVRTERLFRKVRAEVDDLRSTIDALHAVPEELTMLDLDEVAAHPDAAAALPPVILVRALLEARSHNRRLLRRLGKSESRNGRLSASVRKLKQERAFNRGRTQTLDDVIATLHGNLQDLRLHRDHQAQLPATDQARVYANGATIEAIAAPERV